MAEQGAGDKQELPGERVEIPDMAFRISRHREPKDLHHDVKRRGWQQHQERMALHAEQHDREDHQHQNVERQDVEKGRLELQQQGLQHRDVRLVKKISDPHFLIVHRVLEGGCRVGHLGNEDHEQEDVRNIELPSAAQHLGGGV